MFPIKTDGNFRKVEINEDAVNILFRDKITWKDELGLIASLSLYLSRLSPLPLAPFSQAVSRDVSRTRNHNFHLSSFCKYFG